MVLGGRDASQNEELVKKYMTGEISLSTRMSWRECCDVKGRTEKMDEVAQFAASSIRAHGGAGIFPQMCYAQPNQVSKTPQAGEFVARGLFIVRGERTVLPRSPLASGIGLVLEPHAAVIGGTAGCGVGRGQKVLPS